MRRLSLSLMAAAAIALPALAQQKPLPDNLPRVPTPPPAETAENSIIGPTYTIPPEQVANPDVPQGEVREFVMYSDDSKIYPGIVRIANMTRDAYGECSGRPGGGAGPGPGRRRGGGGGPGGGGPGAPGGGGQD